MNITKLLPWISASAFKNINGVRERADKPAKDIILIVLDSSVTQTNKNKLYWFPTNTPMRVLKARSNHNSVAYICDTISQIIWLTSRLLYLCDWKLKFNPCEGFPRISFVFSFLFLFWDLIIYNQFHYKVIFVTVFIWTQSPNLFPS